MDIPNYSNTNNFAYNEVGYNLSKNAEMTNNFLRKFNFADQKCYYLMDFRKNHRIHKIFFLQKFLPLGYAEYSKI